MTIDGNTLLFATAGNPIAQVRLPQVMDAVFRALHFNGVWVPMQADAQGLATVLLGLRTIGNFRGITVAIPHKPAIPAMLDRLTRAAHAAGSVNMVRLENGKLAGDMADGAGFIRGLKLRGISVRDGTVWLVGAGGAGAAIAAALAEAGVARLFLTETDRARAKAAGERLAHYYETLPAEIVDAPPGPVDFAVNATPCGLQDRDPLPFDPAKLDGRTTVCDIIMKPQETALPRAASARGMTIHHGHHTLDAQIPIYLEYFGIPFADEREVIAIASRA